MTGSIALPGLVSGLDTTTLISALMSAEKQPQVLLQKKVATTQSSVTDLQSLNTRIAALVDAAKKASDVTTVHAFKTTSSSANVTIAATGTAKPTDLDIVVDKTASTHTVVSGAMTSWPESPATLTFVSSDGTKTEVTASPGTIDDVVRAVNNSTAGVKATKVASGVDGSGNPLYRIQFGATAPGEEAAFEVYRGSKAAVDGGTATNLLSDSGAAVISQGADAEITLFAGTAAQQKVTSSSNTFTGVVEGVNITVAKASADPVHISVEQDTAATAANAKSFVDQLSSLFAFVKGRSATSSTTDSDGKTTTTGGTFTADPLVRQSNQQLHDAVQYPVNGVSPSEIGISFDKSGVLSFDADKFAAAIKANPDKVDAVFSGLATRVQDAAAKISDKYDGALTKKIQNQQALVTDMNTQISKWDDRLAIRQSALERQYAQLEVSMSNLNSQLSSLNSSFEALTASAKSK
ncbi:flagellar filament capping protein FliD [Leifsonia sp. Leaf264]|uniref:flagellar filament capping protein FliD n=1 Tax=Leifsonia sp. Leaf264 TaxID=1736314 RepID=UPI0006FD1349|nr:flagellar filament capping protein FliD [Leifsonia sp. Leaf264]KQO98226.1 hypothetical protein ASF30_09195 [Leifsonia sp. Leaf264]